MKKLIIAGSMILCGITSSLGAMRAPKQSLSGFKHGGAWVLPITTYYKKADKRNIDYVVLAREAGGRDQGTYDAFGGDIEKGETHPVVTAAREFAEEAITSSTMGMNNDAVLNHIDLDAGNTEAIIAVDDTKYKARNVIYVTNFHESLMTNLKKNFAYARSKATKWKYKEKDRIAMVRFSNLKNAIINSKFNTGVSVLASVTDLQGNTQSVKITLRPVFVRIMRSYFEGKPHTKGHNSKIQFYTI